MDSYLRLNTENVRISSSPRRSPQITEALTSPVRSVHPMQQMDSITSQPDIGLRTIDFFDDTSDEEIANVLHPGNVAPEGSLLDRGRPKTRKRNTIPTTGTLVSQCESKHSPMHPDNEGYQRLTPSGPYENKNNMPDTASSLYNGSVDELLGGKHSSPPQFARSQLPPNGQTPPGSTHNERSEFGQSVGRSTKGDQTLGA